MLAALDGERAVVEQPLVAGRDRRAPRRPTTSRPERGGFRNSKPSVAPPLVGRLDTLGLDPLDLLELRLRLARLRRLVAKALDEALEPRDLLAPGAPRSSRGGPRAPPARAARRARRPGSTLDLPPRARALRSSRPRGTSGRGRRGSPRRRASQHLLEPLERLDVEVVRRLVEQEQVGLRRQCARERRARQLAAREGVRAAGRDRARRSRGRARPRLPGRASRTRPRARASPAPPRSAAGSPRRASPRPSLARAPAAPPRRRRGRRCRRAHSRAAATAAERRRPLVVKCDARALLERELAALERCFACDRTEQGCLAGTVGAGEREAVAALELERDAVEERLAGELLAQG